MLTAEIYIILVVNFYVNEITKNYVKKVIMQMSYFMSDSFLVQIFLFLTARLICVRISYNKIKLDANDL